MGQKPDANTQQFQISVTGSSPIFVVGRSLYSGTLVNLYVKGLPIKLSFDAPVTDVVFALRIVL